MFPAHLGHLSEIWEIEIDKQIEGKYHLEMVLPVLQIAMGQQFLKIFQFVVKLSISQIKS